MQKSSFDQNIETIKIDSSLYPKLLKNIDNPPKTLYIRGELLKNDSCFAIVGTRRCSDYGKEIAFSFAKELSQAGLTIVSGMARGIDTFAHKGAIEGKGKTIAVLGTGLDERSIYPQENLKLAKKILENGGALISEYPPETHGDKFTFPKRNRIISGISLGVLVVEAKLKSGALNTAHWAKLQRRKIFAIPGSIFFQNSKGSHLLIQQGAKLVQAPEEIIKELKMVSIAEPASLKQKQESAKNQEEVLILGILKQGSLPIDKIIVKTKLSPQKVSSVLSLMEIEGKVKNLGGNTFALKR